MSRGQHRQANRHIKDGTKGERATSKITRGLNNVLQVGGLPPVRLPKRKRQAR